MAENEPGQVYVFCNVCQQNVPLNITDEDFEDAKGGLTTVISVHGNPQHAILVYVDKQLKVRGCEYPSVLQVKESESTETPEPEEKAPTAVSEFDLRPVVSSFGEKQDEAIKSFAQIIAQIILGNSIYLIHSNRGIGKVVKEQIDTLFTEQNTHVIVISYDEIDGVSGMRPTIFDLQYGTFISKGITIDTEYFERLVKDVLEDPRGYTMLKNEYSKLMYSYRRLWELLSSGAKKYTRKRLAYLVSIDMSLIPLLLKMAENEEVDVAGRVKS